MTVNFANILQAAFSYQSSLRTFYVHTIWVCNFWQKYFGAKAAHKMLVKLTPDHLVILPALLACLLCHLACLVGLPCWPDCLDGLPALLACLPCHPACLVGLPALLACLPCLPACLFCLPASLALLLCFVPTANACSSKWIFAEVSNCTSKVKKGGKYVPLITLILSLCNFAPILPGIVFDHQNDSTTLSRLALSRTVRSSGFLPNVVVMNGVAPSTNDSNDNYFLIAM
jgi:hypothetical protein